MKTVKSIILLAFLLIASNIQAQFLDKLTKRAKRAAETAAMNKAAEKAFEKAGSSEGGFLNMDNNIFGAFGGSVDPSVLPASYSYEWRYTLRVSHKQGDMDMHYHLREDGTDFASRFEMQQQTLMGGMLMVMDQQRGVMAMLMHTGNEKSGQVMASDDTPVDLSESESQLGDYEFREIGTKEILGYTCQGYEMENEDYTMTMYVAFDTPVSLNKATNMDMQRMPKGFDPKWMDKVGKDNLMMEMRVDHKHKKKFNATITCVALEREPLTIDISEYDFSFQQALQKDQQ